jgi:hypothetical protein
VRRLHVVGKQERFIASGRYVQSSAETASGWIEPWSIHDVGGAWLIRVDNDRRKGDGGSVLLEALVGPDGFHRIDRHTYASQAAQPTKVAAVFYDRSVEITEELGQVESLRLTGDSSLWLGGWILLGMAAFRAAQVIIWQGSAAQSTSLPVRELGTETVSIDQHAHHARALRLGDEGQLLWLDDQGILLRLESNSEKVILKDYARSPEVKHP